MGNTYSDLTFLLVIRISSESPCSKYLIPFIHAIYEINGKPIPNEEQLTDKHQLKELLSEDVLEFKVVNLQERRKQTFKISKIGESLGISVKPLNSIPNFLCLKPLIIEQLDSLNRFDRIIGIEGTYADSLENFFRLLYINRNKEVKLIVLNIGMQSVRKVACKLKEEFNFLNFEVSEATEEEKMELATGVKDVYNCFEEYNFNNKDYINNSATNIHLESQPHELKETTIENNSTSSYKNVNENTQAKISIQITPSVADQLNTVDSTTSNISIINHQESQEIGINEPSLNGVKLPLKPKEYKNTDDFKYEVPKYPGKNPQKIGLTFQDLNLKDTPISKYEIQQLKHKKTNDICNEVYEEAPKITNSSYLEPQPEIIETPKKNVSNVKNLPDYFNVSNNGKFTLDDLLKKKP